MQLPCKLTFLLCRNMNPYQVKMVISGLRKDKWNTFTSPVKDRLLAFNKSKLLPPPLQSIFASPIQPNPGGGGETCAESGIIHSVLTEIVGVSHSRIQLNFPTSVLCTSLQQPPS